jgi:hypothetical protein
VSNDAILRLTQKVHRLERQLRRVQTTGFQRPVWLSTSLTSTDWDGDSYSTTAKTKIDLSAVFSAPANIKAINVEVLIRDSASAANDCWIILAPNNTAAEGSAFRCSGLANDALADGQRWIACDSNGDVYYQIGASGALTMDVWIRIRGYFL